MQPKTGLKRKNYVTITKEEIAANEDENAQLEGSSEDEDLLNSINENEDDSTDSEGEVEEASDGELDGFEGDEAENEEEEDSNDSEEESENEDVSDKELENFENEVNDSDLNDSEEDSEENSDDLEQNEDDEDDKSTETNVKNLKKPSKTNTTQHSDDSKPQESSDLPASKPVDEYEYDTSDEEDIRNTVGNVPKNWYDEYSHLGYDWDGKRILKPVAGDELDLFLKKMEDPDFWRTVKDPQTGQDVVLSEEDIGLIKRIKEQKVPIESFDEHAPWIEWFTSEVMQTPLRKFPDHKRSFLPSRHEEKKVNKLVRALKLGFAKTRRELAKMRARKRRECKSYMLWDTDDAAEQMRRLHNHIPAPKRHLPGHAESYNPPPEYLFDEREMKRWEKLAGTPSKRKLHFVPQKYESLREVPAYERYTQERFWRCLDLFLCPRAIKMKLNIEPEQLVPKLPSPKDLQPFPTTLAIEYEGHKDMVRTISCDTKGQYLVSGSDDHSVKIWEVNTGRCLRTIEFNDTVYRVAWCPNAALSLVAVATGNTVYLMNPMVGDRLVISKTDTLLMEPPEQDVIVSDRVRSTVRWEQIEQGKDWDEKGLRIKLSFFKNVSQVTWHAKGDYFATVMPDGQQRSVLINQLSRRRSQLPFTKNKGLVQCVLFHPIRPFLFVATQRNIRVYDLVKQELVKKLTSSAQWISNMAVHPGGDNLLVGTYDRKMLWFDLDLSTKPYQTLRLHGTAVRAVAYHKRYPLFASASDDKSVIVSHGMVYNDLLQNPLIVPLKRLQNHVEYNDFGVFDVLFHPTQPWIFSAGADGTVKLYS